MKIKDKETGIYLFAINFPFLSFLYALANPRVYHSKNLLWLFVVFYGLNFTPSNLENDADGLRRIEHFEIYTKNPNMSMTDFFEMFRGPVSESYSDFVEPLLMFFTSKLSSDFHILFGLYGIIGGFFLSRIFYLLVKLTNFNHSWFISPYLFTALSLIPFWQMQGFRFWLATIYFLWCILKYFETRSFFFLLITIFSLTIHISFIFCILIIILFIIFRKYDILPFYFIYILSLFISNIDFMGISNFFGQFSGALEYKIVGYGNENYRDVVNELNQLKTNWYVSLREIGIILVTNTILLFSFFYRKKINENKFKEVLILSLIMFSVTNIVSDFPSMGRFYAIANFILFCYFLSAYGELLINAFSKGVYIFFIPILFLYCIVELRIGADNFPLIGFFTNWYLFPFYTPYESLIDTIKNFIS
jgi:hypothetical protein